MVFKKVNLKERSKQKHADFMKCLKESFLSGSADNPTSTCMGSMYGSRRMGGGRGPPIPIVLSIDSINIHCGRFASLGAGDIEMEAELVYDSYPDFDVDALVPTTTADNVVTPTVPTTTTTSSSNTSTTDTMLHTTVSGRLLDQTGTLILEVTPFIIRQPTYTTSMDRDDDDDNNNDDDDDDEMAAAYQIKSWSAAVREGLLLGIHPSLCYLYSKRGTRPSSAISPPPAGDRVMLAAKAALGCPVDARAWDAGTTQGGADILVGWDIYTSTTVMVQVTKM